MWGSWAERWHVALALTSLVVGAAPAAVAVRRRWSAARTAAVATCLALALLALDHLAPWALVAALAAVTASRVRRGREVPAWVVPAVDAVAVVAVVALVDSTAGAMALTGVAAVVVAATGRDVDSRLPAFVAPGAAAIVAGGLWLCVPDTEVPLALGASLAAPLVIALAAPSRAGTDRPGIGASPWVASALALVWTLGDGLAVRPGATVLVLVVAAALAGPGLAVRGRTDGAVGAGPSARALVVGAACVAVAARTVGTGDVVGVPASLLAALLALVALAPWWALVRRTRPSGRAAPVT